MLKGTGPFLKSVYDDTKETDNPRYTLLWLNRYQAEKYIFIPNNNNFNQIRVNLRMVSAMHTTEKFKKLSSPLKLKTFGFSVFLFN